MNLLYLFVKYYTIDGYFIISLFSLTFTADGYIYSIYPLRIWKKNSRLFIYTMNNNLTKKNKEFVLLLMGILFCIYIYLFFSYGEIEI